MADALPFLTALPPHLDLSTQPALFAAVELFLVLVLRRLLGTVGARAFMEQCLSRFDNLLDRPPEPPVCAHPLAYTRSSPVARFLDPIAEQLAAAVLRAAFAHRADGHATNLRRAGPEDEDLPAYARDPVLSIFLSTWLEMVAVQVIAEPLFLPEFLRCLDI